MSSVPFNSETVVKELLNTGAQERITNDIDAEVSTISAQAPDTGVGNQPAGGGNVQVFVATNFLYSIVCTYDLIGN